jgi:hypothetical protein
MIVLIEDSYIGPDDLRARGLAALEKHGNLLNGLPVSEDRISGLAEVKDWLVRITADPS